MTPRPQQHYPQLIRSFVVVVVVVRMLDYDNDNEQNPLSRFGFRLCRAKRYRYQRQS